MDTEADFLKHLRQALNHLYDRDYLRKSPLIGVFGLAGRSDPPAVFQRILIDGIEALKPSGTESARGENRVMYEILLYRYIQQFKQDEVAHHVGVSERQFRREQEKAIDQLAAYLISKYDMPTSAAGKGFLISGESEVGEGEDEWAWLRAHSAERVDDIQGFVAGLVGLMRTVASQHKVDLVLDLPDTSPAIAVHPIALRQILLNLLQVAIDNGDNGKVVLRVTCRSSSAVFAVEALPLVDGYGQRRQLQEANLLQIARHLAKISGGKLEIDWKNGAFQSTLILPVVAGVCVLVIDDYADIIDLLKRYTASTRYHIVGVTEPEKTSDMVAIVAPQVIVMDVMMPKIDGWEMIGRLRSNPASSNIPVIILSILAQEELALSLGAKALVLKPVTQDRFLAALDAVCEDLDSSFH